MSKMTVVLLSYKRPSNIPIILDALSDQTHKLKVWLWNNTGQPISDPRVDKEVVSDANLFCWPRWFMASYATTEYVMMMDDDIFPISKQLIDITVNILDSLTVPEAIVGAEGVILGAEASYWPKYSGRIARDTIDSLDGSVHLKKVVEDVRVDIVKGRCLALRTQALKLLPLFPEHRDTCDDIAVSAILAKGRRRIHCVSSAMGKALSDIHDTNPGVALSRSPDWRTVRDIARHYYYNDWNID